MTYRPGRLRKGSRAIVNARNWAVGIVTALLGLGLFASEIKRIRGLQPDPMDYAYLTLLVLTGVLVFLWIWATQKELDLLFDWLDPQRYVPPSSLKETVLILLFGLLLTALLFAARDPLLYGLVFAVYSTMLIPASMYLNKEIREAIDHSKTRLDEDKKDPTLAARAVLYRAAVEVLQSYFLERPVMLRLVLILCVSIIGVGVALYWKISSRTLWGLSAYVIFFVLILVSEIIVNRWRSIRDGRLREIQAELLDHLRSEEEK